MLDFQKKIKTMNNSNRYENLTLEVIEKTYNRSYVLVVFSNLVPS